MWIILLGSVPLYCLAWQMRRNSRRLRKLVEDAEIMRADLKTMSSNLNISFEEMKTIKIYDPDRVEKLVKEAFKY